MASEWLRKELLLNSVSGQCMTARSRGTCVARVAWEDDLDDDALW